MTKKKEATPSIPGSVRVLVTLDDVLPEKRKELEAVMLRNQARFKELKAARGPQRSDANAFPGTADGYVRRDVQETAENPIQPAVKQAEPVDDFRR